MLGRQRLRPAEVHQDDSAAELAHDVVRLDVAVQQAGGVKRGQRAAEIDPDAGRLARTHRSGNADHRGQRLALDVFHPDSDLLVVLIGAMDDDDVRVADACEVARFGQR